MKKKTVAATVIIVLGVVIAGFPVSAGQNIRSQGNIVFENGDMALYASDIDYLQNEIDNLYDEIPDEDKVSDLTFDYVRRGKIQSKGIIDYAGGTVVINSSDLYYMANEIDALENTYKQIILKYLNGINTYMASDGSITHDVMDNDVAYYPTFEDLINGISLSQEVETETTIDNLSKDKGAWVNGIYITGNGNDVNAAYSQGYIDGVNYTTENANISYVYHKHTGEQSEEGTGCYQGYHGHHESECFVNEGFTNIEYCFPLDESHEYWDSSKRGYIVWKYKCYFCGASTGGIDPSAPAIDSTRHNCPRNCSGVPNEYKIICNKTEGVTIDSATIIFND